MADRESERKGSLSEPLSAKVIDETSPKGSTHDSHIATFDETSSQFAAVVADIAEELNECLHKKLDKIKLVCLHLTTGQHIPILSQEEIHRIQACKSIYNIFAIMRSHWNWSSHRLLFTIIKRVDSPRALALLKKFEKKINYQNKLKDVHEHLKKNKLPHPPGYCKMVAIVDKDYSDISLKEGLEIEDFVSEYLGQAQPSDSTEEQSIQMVWYVPEIAIESLCAKAIQHKEAFIIESFLFLKIGSVVILDERLPKVANPQPFHDRHAMSLGSIIGLLDFTVAPLKKVSEAAKGEFEKGTKVTNYEEAVSCLLNQMKQVKLIMVEKDDSETSRELERNIEDIFAIGKSVEQSFEKFQKLSTEYEATEKELKQELNNGDAQMHKYKQKLEELKVKKHDDAPEEKQESESLELAVPFSDNNGDLMGSQQCMIIDTHNSQYKDIRKAVPMEKAADSSDTASVTSDLRKDIEVIQGYIKRDPLKQLYSIHEDSKSQKSRQFYLECIEELFKDCMTTGGAMLYYTGYGEESTGNWCFKDGTITFQNIFTLYKKYLKGKLLYIATDCSYSGQWVVECAKCLDEMAIGACGHKTREQGILIKVWASCQPHQKACCHSFVIQAGIEYLEIWNSTVAYYNKKLSNTQTTYGCDFTRITCLENHTSPCQLPKISSSCSWRWKNVIDVHYEQKQSKYIYIIRGKIHGKDHEMVEIWFIVLIKSDLGEKYQSTGTINFADFGHVIKADKGEGLLYTTVSSLVEFKNFDSIRIYFGFPTEL
ncbi:uncharacterized protein [Dysidea avara]|uniref:uncharacterized protein isoform X2 n=1 Tax=Dysidea avara TaxID=196820 RepID=UPI003320CF9F